MPKNSFRISAPAWSIRMGRVQDAQADVSDARDQVYTPSLEPLKPFLLPFDSAMGVRPRWWSDDRIRDQGRNPSCVGHALAALVDHMRADALVISHESDPTTERPWASAEMLYQLARFHDEWIGENYNGSSIRGALKGFFYNGVASQQEVDKLSRDEAAAHEQERAKVTASVPEEDTSWYMTKELQEEARTVQLGAYYRIRPRLADVHAALNETKAVIVSAATHNGWMRPSAQEPTIVFDERLSRDRTARHLMHAFVVVGYDSDGFWVQNSWGRNWGRGGLARWLYEDWAANVVDAWVLRLDVLPTARDGQRGQNRGVRARLTAYGARIERSETHFLSQTPTDSTGPSRLDVLGHYVPFRDGLLDRYGPYNVNSKTLLETLSLIRKRYVDGAGPNGRRFADEGVVLRSDERKYHHILIYFVGGWEDEDRLASEIARATPCFLRLGIYPFFVAWDTPIFCELTEMLKRTIKELTAISWETPTSRRAVRDRLVEVRVAEMTNRILRDLRCSARRVFLLDQPDPEFPAAESRQGNGSYALSQLFEGLSRDYRAGVISYHLAAHGFGSQMLLECLAQQQQLLTFAHVSTCTLISPLVWSHRLGHQLDRSESARSYSLFDCLLSRGERPRRRGRIEDLSIESLRLIVLNEAALRADRFIDGYGRSWPEFWSYVMGRDPVAREKGLTTAGPGDAHGDPRSASQWLPLLALPKEAEKFAQAAADVGLDVERLAVVCSEEEMSSLHHELGFHHSVLDALASKILGRDADGSFIGGGRTIRIERHP